jgi:hypothetical protein
MLEKHEPVLRNGFWDTRQGWQRFDRCNAILGGLLIIVQGGRSFAPDSGTTHRLLGVKDYRRWHLNSTQAAWVTRVLRDNGGTGHERTTWQGFSAHFHDATLGDDVDGVMDPVAIQQCATYRAGGDGVSGTVGDWQPYRPSPIRNYVYQEDDVTPEEHQMLEDIKADAQVIREKLFQFAGAEFERDEAEVERDQRRFQALESAAAAAADSLTVAINRISNRATKEQLNVVRNDILAALSANPRVVGKNNPDPSQLGLDIK